MGVPFHSYFDWTDERIERLKKLWADGERASVIAEKLGGGLSRCAVLGKIHRLGLSGRTGGRPRKRPSPRPVASGVVTDRAMTANEVHRHRLTIPADTRDITARLMGDPLPERSALAQRGRLHNG